MKSGEVVVSDLPKQIKQTFENIEKQKQAAREMYADAVEKDIKLWEQIKEDYELDNDFAYAFNKKENVIKLLWRSEE